MYDFHKLVPREIMYVLYINEKAVICLIRNITLILNMIYLGRLCELGVCITVHKRD